MLHSHSSFADMLGKADADTALQFGIELALARRAFEQIAPGKTSAQAVQRDEVSRLSGEINGCADRAGIDRIEFRAALEQQLRRDHGSWVSLAALQARAQLMDEDRRRLEGARLDAEHALIGARDRLRAARKEFAASSLGRKVAMRERKAQEYEDVFIAADQALMDYDRASGAQA